MQEVVGDVGVLLVGVVDGLDGLDGVSLEDEELRVGVSSLDECDDVLGVDDLLRLCVELWWELGELEDVVLSWLLVPTGVVGMPVGDGAIDEDDVSVGVVPVPCGVFPGPLYTTAVAPATNNTAVVPAPMSVLRRGPPGPAGASSAGTGSSPSPSSPSSAAAATSAAASSDT